MEGNFRSRSELSNARRRVVVTGLGALSAAGLNKEALWDSLLTGRSGIGPITRFDPTGMASRIAGEVRGFDPVNTIDARLKPRRMSRQTQLGVAAAMQALEDAGVHEHTFADKAVDVVMGVSTSSSETIIEGALLVERGGPGQATPWRLFAAGPQPLPSAVATMITAKRISAHAISSACAAGIDAIGEAFHRIRDGQIDAAVCGGADAPISKTPMAEFTLAGLSSTQNDEPNRASRPFDRERDSGVLAEGGAAVVLETLESARARGVKCYLEILGYQAGMDSDENYPCGGLTDTMSLALSDAACRPEEVDFISAWGCGHPVLDSIETDAIKRVFKKRAYEIAVGSIKGVVGNPGAAAGPMQIVSLALTYQHGILPPAVNYRHQDVRCDLDYVLTKRRVALRRALLNAHGLGGGNGSMIISGLPS